MGKLLVQRVERKENLLVKKEQKENLFNTELQY